MVGIDSVSSQNSGNRGINNTSSADDTETNQATNGNTIVTEDDEITQETKSPTLLGALKEVQEQREKSAQRWQEQREKSAQRLQEQREERQKQREEWAQRLQEQEEELARILKEQEEESEENKQWLKENKQWLKENQKWLQKQKKCLKEQKPTNKEHMLLYAQNIKKLSTIDKELDQRFAKRSSLDNASSFIIGLVFFSMFAALLLIFSALAIEASIIALLSMSLISFCIFLVMSIVSSKNTDNICALTKERQTVLKALDESKRAEKISKLSLAEILQQPSSLQEIELQTQQMIFATESMLDIYKLNNTFVTLVQMHQAPQELQKNLTTLSNELKILLQEITNAKNDNTALTQDSYDRLAKNRELFLRLVHDIEPLANQHISLEQKAVDYYFQSKELIKIDNLAALQKALTQAKQHLQNCIEDVRHKVLSAKEAANENSEVNSSSFRVLKLCATYIDLPNIERAFDTIEEQTTSVEQC